MENLKNKLQKFYCSACEKETLGLLRDIQTAHGIRESIMCTECGHLVSLSLLASLIDSENEIKNNIYYSDKIDESEYVKNNIYYSDKIDESEYAKKNFMRK